MPRTKIQLPAMLRTDQKLVVLPGGWVAGWPGGWLDQMEIMQTHLQLKLKLKLKLSLAKIKLKSLLPLSAFLIKPTAL